MRLLLLIPGFCIVLFWVWSHLGYANYYGKSWHEARYDACGEDTGFSLFLLVGLVLIFLGA